MTSSCLLYTSRVLRQLTALSDRGNDIEEQNVDYAIEMGKEDQEDRLMEMDADCICHTINGKPIKPKTLGQKAYVDAIRKNMIVFGLGPAGTGKTYLAMAMACLLYTSPADLLFQFSDIQLTFSHSHLYSFLFQELKYHVIRDDTIAGYLDIPYKHGRNDPKHDRQHQSGQECFSPLQMRQKKR